MLLSKHELFLGKNAKDFILAVLFGFWALFLRNSPGLETLELHLVDFEPLNIIDRSLEPHTSVHTLIRHSEVPHSSRIRSPTPCIKIKSPTPRPKSFYWCIRTAAYGFISESLKNLPLILACWGAMSQSPPLLASDSTWKNPRVGPPLLQSPTPRLTVCAPVLGDMRDLFEGVVYAS